MTEIDWNCLPEHNWIQIFGNLDFKSILNVTETCTKFAELFAATKSLSDKVRIVLDISNDLTTKLAILEQSKRRYENLKIEGQIWKNYTFDENRNPILPNMGITTNDAIKIREAFGNSIVDLILEHSTNNFDLEILLASFDKLKSCSLNFWRSYCDGPESNELQFSEEQQENYIRIANPSVNIERIEFERSAIVCMNIFRNSTNLRTLTFNGELYGKEMEVAEKFLMKQKNLKELCFIDCNLSFKTKLIKTIPFQLEKFSLRSGTWKSPENTRDFFLSQRNLKSIELSFKKYDEDEWFDLLFKQVLPSNKNLRSISISTCRPREMEDFVPRWPISDDDTLITKIRACNDIFSPNVKELKYEKRREEKTNAFLQSFVEIFPNLKILCLDYCLNKEELRLIASFKHLESLSFESKTSDLIELQVTSKNLTTVKYRSRERPSEFLDEVLCHMSKPKPNCTFGEKWRNYLLCYSQEDSLTNFECLKEFMDRHPMIRHLSLDTPRISQLSSYPIDEILAEHLPNLESFCDKFTFIDPTTLRSILSKLKMIGSLHIRVNEENQKEIQEICEFENVKLKFQEIKATYEKIREGYTRGTFPYRHVGEVVDLDLS